LRKAAGLEPAGSRSRHPLARENQVVLFEAFKTASLPNFLLLQQSASRQTAQSLYQLLPVLFALSALSRR
jgi:hypothetical protein